MSRWRPLSSASSSDAFASNQCWLHSIPSDIRRAHWKTYSRRFALTRSKHWWISVPSPCRGGCRKKIRDDSPHIALRNATFRNYADYMLTAEFDSALANLVALAENSPTAYMCAERVYFRCHRMLVSDWLLAHGHEVLHIDGTGPVKPHRLTKEARMVEGELIYRGDRLL